MKQGWFKIFGQNEKTWIFESVFLNLGLKLDKKWREQKLLRILPEIKCCNFFYETLNQKFIPKMGPFGFFN